MLGHYFLAKSQTMEKYLECQFNFKIVVTSYDPDSDPCEHMCVSAYNALCFFITVMRTFLTWYLLYHRRKITFTVSNYMGQATFEHFYLQGRK